MYSWRDGEDVLFDETFVHCAENRSAHDRIIFFCDVERPLRPRWLGYLTRAVSGVLGRATATQNLASYRVGVVNRLFAPVHWLKQRSRPPQHFNSTLSKLQTGSATWR